MSDIVERLRQGEDEGVDGWWSVMAEGANEIERLRAAYEAMDKMLREANQHFMRVDMERNKLRAENEKLRAALKPFADEASVGPMPGQPYDPRRCSMKFLRAAAAALKETVE